MSATDRRTSPGAWDHVYAGMEQATPFGGYGSYEVAAEWTRDCELVEDWGCGKGWMRTLIEPERYRGIDGSASPFADEVVDLATYRSSVPGVVMRHVLEHDWRWAAILDNAIASFTEAFALVLFSPLQRVTREVGREADAKVPVIGFRLEDVTGRIPADCSFMVDRLAAESGPGWDAVYDETVILVTR